MRLNTSTEPKRFPGAFLLFALASSLFLPVKCLAVSSSNILNFETGIRTDDNVTYAAEERDRLSDTVFSFRLTGGQRFQLGRFDSLSAQLDCERNLSRGYEGLNDLKGGIAAAWWHKFGIGPMKPLLTIGAAASKRDRRYNDLDERRYEFSAGLRQRLSEKIDITAALEHETHKTRDPVYNGNSGALNLTLGIAAPADARIQLGYGLRRGDVTWYFTSPTPLSWASMSGLFDMYYIPWYSETELISATVLYPLGLKSSAYLGLERHDTTWHTLSYPNNILKAGFNYNFQ